MPPYDERGVPVDDPEEGSAEEAPSRSCCGKRYRSEFGRDYKTQQMKQCVVPVFVALWVLPDLLLLLMGIVHWGDWGDSKECVTSHMFVLIWAVDGEFGTLPTWSMVLSVMSLILIPGWASFCMYIQTKSLGYQRSPAGYQRLKAPLGVILFVIWITFAYSLPPYFQQPSTCGPMHDWYTLYIVYNVCFMLLPPLCGCLFMANVPGVYDCVYTLLDCMGEDVQDNENQLLVPKENACDSEATTDTDEDNAPADKKDGNEEEAAGEGVNEDNAPAYKEDAPVEGVPAASVAAH